MIGPLSSSTWRTGAVALLLCVAGVLPLLTQQKTEIPPSGFLSESQLENVTVARVGTLSISGLEFKLGYEFGPAFPKREKDSKKRYLNFLVCEKLLALDAQRRGLDQWPDVKRQVSEIEGDLATEELYKQDVLAKIHIPNRQLTKNMEAARIGLSLQWIFCKSASDVDDLARAMKAGVAFDTLYIRQFNDRVSPDDRSTETTVFKLRMRNPLFATVVETMKAGETSLPVHGPDGWYFIKMAGRTTNPIATQSDMMRLEEDIRRALTQQIADTLSDRYVNDLVASHKPIIIRGPLNAVQAFLGSRFLTKEQAEEWKINTRKGANELEHVSDLDTIGDTTLVETKTGNFAIKDFLEWYRMREPYIKMDRSSTRGFFQSTEELVWRMVRDRLLTRAAYARGLQNLPGVRRQTQWWKEKMLYTANKNRIADTVKDSLALIRRYYNEHPHLFRDMEGHVKPFEAAYDDALRQYHAGELTKKLLHEILQLKKTYGVTVDEGALERIKVDEQENPKTIDVYTVKTKGIYPRMAFPSIDYEWQSWD